MRDTTLALNSPGLLHFRYEDTAYAGVRKRVLILYGIVYAGVIVAIFLNEFVFNKSSGTNSWISFSIPVLVVSTLSVISTPRLLQRMKVYMDSYLLTFTQDSIIRDVHNTPSIIILKEDIRSIKKSGKGTIVIRSANNGDAIHIPYQIANRDRLEQELSAFSHVAMTDEKISRTWLTFAMLGLMAASLITVMVTPDPYIGIGAVIVFLSLVVRSFFFIRSNKNVDYRSKRRAWIQLVIALIVAISSALKFFL